MPTTSLVIPTLNAGDEIGILLEKIQHQTVVPDEILIVDSSSEDDTQEIVRSFQKDGVRLKVIDRSDFDHGGTRHSAFLETSGEITLFMTQDAVPADEKCFEKLITVFEDQDVALAYARQLPKQDARRYEQLVRNYNYPNKSKIRDRNDIESLGIKTYFCSDVCSAYRREAYFSVGGFIRPCSTNEDMFIAAQLISSGYKVAYSAEAQVYHSHNLTFKEQLKRNRASAREMSKNAKLLRGANEFNEGTRMFKDVASALIAEGNIAELIAFFKDCCGRLIGNRLGRFFS